MIKSSYGVFKNISVVVFSDGENVILQRRGSHSKLGEKYGFFGGSLKKAETPERAIKRELLEEIGFVPEGLNYCFTFSFTEKRAGKYENWRFNLYVFLSPITEKLEKTFIAEGDGLVKLPIDKVLKGKCFDMVDVKILRKLRKF